jgi:stalled ribosome alternative rescue factor ArfA
MQTVVVHDFNLNIWKTKAGKFLGNIHPELYRDPVSKKKKGKKKERKKKKSSINQWELIRLLS